MKTPNVRFHSALVLVATLAATPARPQDDLQAKPGQRVRVTAAVPGRFTGTTTGNIMKVAPDNLTLFDPERGNLMELPLSTIQRVEVSQGSRRGTGKGFLIGLAIGAGFGALAYWGLQDYEQGCGGYPGDPFHECSSGEKLGIAAMSAAMGAATGAFIGHRKQREVWSDTPIERLKVTLRPARGGARVALALSF